jgi:hypothetical protein
MMALFSVVRGKEPSKSLERSVFRQSCSYCTSTYYKPNIAMWWNRLVTAQSGGGCVAANSSASADVLTCLDNYCLPCPTGGLCNTTGVVMPAREAGYWRASWATAEDDFIRYPYYSCLTVDACRDTLPLTADDLYKVGGNPDNSQCAFSTYYDGSSRAYKNYSGTVNRGRLDSAPLCSVCEVGVFRDCRIHQLTFLNFPK